MMSDGGELTPESVKKELEKKYSKKSYSLIPVCALEDMADVMTSGARKYGADNWKTVNYTAYIDALFRHLIEVLKNPTSIDKESGLLHISHLLANAAILDYKIHEMKEIQDEERKGTEDISTVLSHNLNPVSDNGNESAK